MMPPPSVGANDPPIRAIAHDINEFKLSREAEGRRAINQPGTHRLSFLLRSFS